ncbi:MAG: molybdopterin-dependent oxidoreductase [Actinobacteria bacterium]|nr:molybdopterin-dependent oxidoreductase [Actinomycetota bacterium]
MTRIEPRDVISRRYDAGAATEPTLIGRDLPRVDGPDKAAGAALYTDDLRLPGMLHGRLLRSPHAHARIVNIDTSRAAALNGVRCIITGRDIPLVRFGNWRLMPDTQDQHALCIDKVRYIGDEVAAVVAIDVDTAEEALSLIKVEYESLDAVFEVLSSLSPEAPLLHEELSDNVSVNRRIEYGDPEQGLAESDLILDNTFTVHAVSAAYLEPCSALARYEPGGRFTVWSSTQVPYILQCMLAATLGVRENDVRVIKPAVGGGFGGKMELRAWEFCAAFAARETGRPVKFTLSREEELAYGRRRHPMTIHSRVGFRKDGTLVAKDLEILLDGGAYNAMGPTATFLSGNFGAMLYRYPSYRYWGRHVYTNKPPASAMRGFGAPQSLFVSESQMNMAAKQLGIDPIEIRIKNAMRTGDVIPDVATISSCGFIESLEKAAEISGWHEKRRAFRDKLAAGSAAPTASGAAAALAPRRLVRGLGVGCYSFISGGVFNWFNTQYPFSAAEVRAFSDGTVHLLTMAADIGQGSDSVLVQILAEELGLDPGDIRLTAGDTAMTPQADLGTWGSRVTLMAGNAVLDAARKIKEDLFGALSARFGLNVIYDLECRDGRVQVKGRPDRGLAFGEAVAMVQKSRRGEPLIAHGYYTPRGKGLVTPAFSFGTQVAEVEVDLDTGQVQVQKMWTAHDCGVPLNPMGVEGQLEGSIHMGLGYALYEQFAMEDGRTLNTTFLDYKIPTALDMPTGESVTIETYEPEGPFGAKEAGEGLVSPTAPAIAEAVYHATEYRCMDLPITPEKILAGLDEITSHGDTTNHPPTGGNLT